MKKNILLIIVDCARAEKTVVDIPGATGKTRKSARTPFLDVLRERGTTWTNFHSVSSTTTPNLASMFTGKLPVEHGVERLWNYRLDERVRTIAEVMSYHRYHTFAEVTGPLFPHTSLDRGFSGYNYRNDDLYLHTGLLPRIIHHSRYLRKPWFLCVHLWEVHKPYLIPERFRDDRYGLTPYDKVLSMLDHNLMKVFDRSKLDNTAIIYTSDHGERLEADFELNSSLGGQDEKILTAFRKFKADRGNKFNSADWEQLLVNEFGKVEAAIYSGNVLGHSSHLREEMIRIPLVIFDGDKIPAGKVNDNLRSQTDLFETIMDLADIPLVEGDTKREHSLLNSYDEKMIYIEANGCGDQYNVHAPVLRGAKNKRWKYWRIVTDEINHRVLWDLENDPRETVSVIDSHPEVAARMERFVESVVAKRTSRPSSSMDEATSKAIEERLKSLGYL